METYEKDLDLFRKAQMEEKETTYGTMNQVFVNLDIIDF